LIQASAKNGDEIYLIDYRASEGSEVEEDSFFSTSAETSVVEEEERGSLRLIDL